MRCKSIQKRSGALRSHYAFEWLEEADTGKHLAKSNGAKETRTSALRCVWTLSWKVCVYVYSLIGSIEFSRVPYLVPVGLRSMAKLQEHMGLCSCPSACTRVCVLACLFLAVVVSVGSVIDLLGVLVSVAPQYVLQAGHTL